MQRAVLLALLVASISNVSASRWPLSAPQTDATGKQPTRHLLQQAPPPGALAPPQPWQPFQQLQQQIQQEMKPAGSNTSSNSSTSQQANASAPTPLTPSMEFVTIQKQERPAELKQAQQQQKQQQEPQVDMDKFECGKPYMPCGSAIPEGKKCDKGAGWCEPGYFCGYEATTTESSR